MYFFLKLIWTDQAVAEEICEFFAPRDLKFLWQDGIRWTMEPGLVFIQFWNVGVYLLIVEGMWREGTGSHLHETLEKDTGFGQMLKLEVVWEGPVGQEPIG